MTTTQSLFDLSERHGHLYLEPLKDSPINSVALLLPSGRTAWTVNPEGMTNKQLRDHISHELGHAEEHAFYTRISAPTCRDKCEENARRWQYRKMVPLEDLISAVNRGVKTTWDLSELFEMPEDFIEKAFEYYEVHEGIDWKTM